VDIGGTFTDLVVVRGDTGQMKIAKSLTTPDDLTRGVLSTVAEALGELADVTAFVHGTTAGTNAVIERKGARVGLLTTRGFRDVLEIMRINRESHYDVQWSKPAPLVPRRLRFEVSERIDHLGHVVLPLDEADVHYAVEQMQAAHVDSIAICFLFSFVNPVHELQARAIIEKGWPKIPVSVSSEILPEIREYERTSTVVIDAYVKPLLAAYFRRIERALKERGLAVPLRILSSAGGTLPAQEASRLPVYTLQSGPAGGVIGAAYLAAQTGHKMLISIDVGGTSFDVSVIEGGTPRSTTDGAIQWGIPFKVPMVDVKSIGAGGGSIAHVDAGGLLQVGPHSAGGRPGPVCYGRGGELPTLTDAFVVIGAINPNYFLGGKIRLDVPRARTAIERHIARPLRMTVEAAALGVIRIAEASMIGAMHVVSTQRGYDPRDYSLIAYGGAGPLVAADLARELGIRRVIIPRFPGAFCAFGMLCADLRFDFVRSYVKRLAEVDRLRLRRLMDDCVTRADAAFARVGYRGERLCYSSADVRYWGQNFELGVLLPGQQFDDAEIAEIARRFHEEHRRRYGHRKLDEPIELVNLRLTAIGVTDKPPVLPPRRQGPAAPKDRRTVLTRSGEPSHRPVFERDDLPIGWKAPGPLIIEEIDTCIICECGDTAAVDPAGNLLIAIGEDLK
jgi:N-methylhydantoinase A